MRTPMLAGAAHPKADAQQQGGDEGQGQVEVDQWPVGVIGAGLYQAVHSARHSRRSCNTSYSRLETRCRHDNGLAHLQMVTHLDMHAPWSGPCQERPCSALHEIVAFLFSGQLHSHASKVGCRSCRLAYDGVTEPGGSLEIKAQHHCEKRHIERSAANAG